MDRAAFKKLAQQWYQRARESGFEDIEAPSGIIPRRSVPETRTAEVAELEAARVFLHAHTFASAWERQVWELHVEGESNREIARRLRNGRKRVEAVLGRLTAIMNGQRPAARRRGRRPDPEGFRAEDMQVRALLLPGHALALDHIRQALQVSRAEAVRRGLMELRNRISRDTKVRGQ